MGIESPVPFANATARRLNFANEGGWSAAIGPQEHHGLWLVQRIRQESGSPDDATLVEARGWRNPWRSVVTERPSVLHPPSMTAAIRDSVPRPGSRCRRDWAPWRVLHR